MKKDKKVLVTKYCYCSSYILQPHNNFAQITEKDSFKWHALHKSPDEEFKESAAVDKLRDKDKEAEFKRQEI